MTISFFAENIKKPPLKYKFISNWLKVIIGSNSKKTGKISYIFCEDAYLLEINKEYLNHDYFTDIITFDYVEGDLISGDIFISTERVAENAMKFGVILEDEFLRVIVHGVLHLLNFNDSEEGEIKIMREKETEYISLFKRLENEGSFQL